MISPEAFFGTLAVLGSIVLLVDGVRVKLGPWLSERYVSYYSVSNTVIRTILANPDLWREAGMAEVPDKDQYPQGKLTDDDEGVLTFGVTDKDGKVIIQYSKSIHWVGMPPDQAIELAMVLLRRAFKLQARG